MTLSGGEYLLGVLELAAIAGSLAFAAWRVRRLVLPAWTGPPARLVEIVFGVVGLLWLSKLLGSLGIFEDWPITIGALVVAAVVGLATGGVKPPVAGPAPPSPPSNRIAWVCAAVITGGVVAGWAVPVLQTMAAGMDRADTLWYHMPLAARWVQTGDLTAIDHFDPIFFAGYYPANSEVFHAVGILAFDRDILSPLINVGFLGIALLSAYCIGRPYGLGPHSLVGAAIALGSQQLVEFQAGEALNDITGVAFVLAAVAVLMNAWAAMGQEEAANAARPGLLTYPQDTQSRAFRAALVAAGLSAGVAAGTKLSVLAPVVALAVGVAVIAKGGWRGRFVTFALFTGPALLAGGYWYLRNAIAIGNPLPFTSWGPLDLPMPARDFELREPFSVAHYATDFDVWADWFFPALDNSFGIFWPAVVLGFLGAGVYAVWRGSTPYIRVVGAVILFTAVAYVFTPLTAAGEEGAPISFEWNVRYIAPAAAMGFALLPLLAGKHIRIVLGLLTVVAVSSIASLVQWEHGHVKGAAAAGVGVFLAFGIVAWLRDRNLVGAAAPRRFSIGLAALIAAGAVGAGWVEQRHYLEHRYDDLDPEFHIAEAARWGREIENSRIATAGVRGVFNQYPFYGTKLTNHVQWLGIEGPNGAYLRIPDCETWREELAKGRYEYVVTMYDPYEPRTLTDTKEAVWTREDAGATEILRDGPVSVFKLESPPNPDTCGDLPDLSEAELNGDSVNLEPTANQPPPEFSSPLGVEETGDEAPAPPEDEAIPGPGEAIEPAPPADELDTAPGTGDLRPEPPADVP